MSKNGVPGTGPAGKKAAEPGPGTAEEIPIPDYVMLDFANGEGPARRKPDAEQETDIDVPSELFG